MKKIITCILFLFFAVFAANAQDRSYIHIVNNTGYEIYFVFMSSSYENSWGPDLLAEDQTLQNGETFTYQLPYFLRDVEIYDILLEDLDGDTYTKWGVAVTANAIIIFTIDDIDFDET